jgi:outer membrane murein-binding lipoprotein Lpp
MRRLVLVGIILSGLVLAGCGKYGKPVRQAPQDPDAEKRYTLLEPASS